MPKKKRKKKREIPILPFFVSGIVIALGAGIFSTRGKDDAIEVEPENGNGKLPDTRIRDCIDSGGVWNDQFQICEFPERPEQCGPAPTLPPGIGVYWQSTLRRQDIGWATVPSRLPPNTIVLVTGGFSREYLDWLRCRQRTGQL